jgi:hypothetical protein
MNDNIKDRIKDRFRQLRECKHERTKTENDSRFGLLVICMDCDTVIDVKNN